MCGQKSYFCFEKQYIRSYDMKIGELDLGEYPVILAPMEDITDPPFRTLCREHGADMSYSEFISADGLIRNAEKSLVKLVSKIRNARWAYRYSGPMRTACPKRLV